MEKIQNYLLSAFAHQAKLLASKFQQCVISAAACKTVKVIAQPSYRNHSVSFYSFVSLGSNESFKVTKDRYAGYLWA